MAALHLLHRSNDLVAAAKGGAEEGAKDEGEKGEKGQWPEGWEGKARVVAQGVRSMARDLDEVSTGFLKGEADCRSTSVFPVVRCRFIAPARRGLPLVITAQVKRPKRSDPIAWAA